MVTFIQVLIPIDMFINHFVSIIAKAYGLFDLICKRKLNKRILMYLVKTFELNKSTDFSGINLYHFFLWSRFEP